MKALKNEKGIALVMVLVLSGIALAIMAGLIYMVTSGTQVSGLQKRYKTALECSMAGAEVVYAVIGERDTVSFPFLTVTYNSSDDCMISKFTLQTSSVNWAACTPFAKATSSTINPTDATTYDFLLDLGADPYTCRVNAKIVDTIEGNTAPDSGWIQGGVVWSKSEFYPVPRPYYYDIEVHTEKQDQQTPERAKLSILYQH